MAINKVVYNGNTLMDVTACTVDEEHLAEGFTALNAAGALITGTMTGGGGIAPFTEYETGIMKLTSSNARPTVNFSRTHSAPPALVILFDDTATINTQTNGNEAFILIDYEKIFGIGYSYSGSARRKAQAFYIYRGTSSTSVSNGGLLITNGASSATASSTAYFRYWADASSFRPYSNSTSRVWVANRTHTWYAYWK